ncbi:hypothetical protein MKX01_019542 [Papaver californicum]|nr:hypothetical protein MKX01_019542 [Papaver californicum]
MAVVILDALTRRQWVREEDLAKDLKLGTKQLRHILCIFEEEKLVTRVSRKETARFNAAVANITDGHGKEGEKKKVHTYSYCCLDYSQICDVVRYKLHHMKQKLKDELDSSNTVEEYLCPRCKKMYNALDALQLISPTGGGFQFENCNGDLKLASDEMGGGDDNARRRRREKSRDMLQKMEEQLKPLLEQLDRVEHLTCPEFGTLKEWEARASGANGDASGNDPSKSTLPFMGDTKVEVELSGAPVKEEDIEPETGVKKVYPPWIMQGMNLTKEQRGEVLSFDRQVGTKSKRTETDKLNELKVYVEESEEYEIDWEDG